MDRQHYEEMVENLDELERLLELKKTTIFLFGHCNASEELAKLLMDKGYPVEAFLDNNVNKQGTRWNDIPIVSPQCLAGKKQGSTVVFIVARAYEEMVKQLRRLGYSGRIEKLVEYNSFAEYSLSEETRERKQERLQQGMDLLERMKQKYPGCFRIYCPFAALGDVSFAMSYLPYFLKERSVSDFVVCVIGSACASVVAMYGVENIECVTQKEMDLQVQAVIYTQDRDAFIAHHDRPYVQTVYKALYIKKIPLEQLYRCGVFGLPDEVQPHRPSNLSVFLERSLMPKGKTVILSPYAKSVTNISDAYWEQLVSYFQEQGYVLYTNVTETEKELQGTRRLEVPLNQIQSVVEHAGFFVGIRSGLCDVLRWAECKKIALYPDVYYSDTNWKMEEIYYLNEWNNVVITEKTDIISEIVPLIQ